MIKQFILFLILNFFALALGSYFTSDGVISDWYLGLNKAPWTPPGWFFGVAWTVIMILFAAYMANVWTKAQDKKRVLVLYGLQWILNVSWNPVFFHWHQAGLGLLVISGLLVLLLVMYSRFRPLIKNKSLLLLPYVAWIIVATSLNAYVVFAN